MNDLPDEQWGEILSFLRLREIRDIEGTSKQVLRIVRENLRMITNKIEFLFSYHDSAESDLGSVFAKRAFENVSFLGVHLGCKCIPIDLDVWFPRLETLALHPTKPSFVGTKSMHIFADKRVKISFMYVCKEDDGCLVATKHTVFFVCPPTLKRLLLNKKIITNYDEFGDVDIIYHKKSEVEVKIFTQQGKYTIPIKNHWRHRKVKCPPDQENFKFASKNYPPPLEIVEPQPREDQIVRPVYSCPQDEYIQWLQPQFTQFNEVFKAFKKYQKNK